nr:MAG TPA: hypothetical protein [Caudoviricetes sp.]
MSILFSKKLKNIFFQKYIEKPIFLWYNINIERR